MQREKGFRCSKSGSGRPHGKHAAGYRRRAAAARAAERAARTPEQQLAKLDREGRVAARERKRLFEASTLAEIQAALDPTPTDTSKRVRRHARGELQP